MCVVYIIWEALRGIHIVCEAHMFTYKIHQVCSWAATFGTLSLIVCTVYQAHESVHALCEALLGVRKV